MPRSLVPVRSSSRGNDQQLLPGTLVDTTALNSQSHASLKVVHVFKVTAGKSYLEKACPVLRRPSASYAAESNDRTWPWIDNAMSNPSNICFVSGDAGRILSPLSLCFLKARKDSPFWTHFPQSLGASKEAKCSARHPSLLPPTSLRSPVSCPLALNCPGLSFSRCLSGEMHQRLHKYL